jgi:hypothetical protein
VLDRGDAACNCERSQVSEKPISRQLANPGAWALHVYGLWHEGENGATYYLLARLAPPPTTITS